MRKSILFILALAFSLSLQAQNVFVRDLKIVVETVGQETVLTPNGPDVSYLWVSLSPDRKHILYYVPRQGAYVCDLSGKNVKHLGWMIDPMWMDDDMVAGKLEYYGPNEVPEYRAEYFCVSRDGKMRRDLTEHEAQWFEDKVVERRRINTERNFARVAARNAVQATEANTVGLSGIKIYLNPGHGGYDANDRSCWTVNVPEMWTNPAGYWESKSNLVKALFLYDMLQAAGAQVMISRTENTSGARDIDYYPNVQNGSAEYNAIMAGGDRYLSEIAEEANAYGADHFLSIHSNAVNNRTNYLLMLYHGEDGQPTVVPSNQMAAMAGSVQIKNTLTVWNASTPYIRGDITFYGDSPTDPLAGLGVLRPLTVPGHLSEGSFHDYAPETHRLMNDDYCHLEALRMFQYFHKWFNRQLPQTACISGWVKSSNQTVDDLGYSQFYYFPNTDDQWLPLNGATVILMNAEGTPLDTVVTDDWYNGIFAFYDLTPGTYTVRAEKGGYIAGEQTVTVAAEDIAQLKFKLPYTRIDMPDFEEPLQDPGTLILPDYSFNKIGDEHPVTESFRRVLYRDGKVYALRQDGMITRRDLQMNVLDTLPSLPSVQWSDIAFASDNFLMAGVAAENSWKVYLFDPDFSSVELMLDRTLQGSVTGTLASSAPHWKATLWTTTATDILSLNFDEDHPSDGQVTATATAGLNVDSRMTLVAAGQARVDNDGMIPCAILYAGHNLMVKPEQQGGKVGFRLWDMSADSPVAISAFQAMSGNASRAHAYAYVDKYVMHIYIVAEGLGVQHFVSSIPELANIYASELNFANGKFTFRLNADANTATLKIEKNHASLGSFELGALAMGAHEVTNPFNTTDFDAYELTVTADPVSYPALISDDDPLFSFSTPIGVAVDKTANSPFFGRIYVTNANAGTAGGRQTGKGVYILSSDMMDVTAQGSQAYAGGVTWGDHKPDKNYQLALARPAVGPDGEVYIPSATAKSSGVYIMDPANPGNAFTAVFDGKRNSTSGKIKKNGVVVTNPVMHCVVAGYGEDKRLYTMDHDIASTTLSSSIWKYNLGQDTLPWDQAPSGMEYNDQQYGKMQNGSGQIARDGRGGWWLSQYRYSSTEAVPSLIHVTNGTIDYNSGTVIGTSQQGGMAVTRDGSLLAIGRELGTIAVYEVTYSSKGRPSLKQRHVIDYGDNFGDCVTMGCEFDAAGNLYVVSPTNGRLMIFTMPNLNNTYTTRRSGENMQDPNDQEPVVDGLQSVSNDAQVHKIIRNGQLIIQRGDEQYNAQGIKL